MTPVVSCVVDGGAGVMEVRGIGVGWSRVVCREERKGKSRMSTLGTQNGRLEARRTSWTESR